MRCAWVLCLAVALVAGCGGKRGEPADGGAAEAAAIETTAQELIEAYRANTVSADARFKDKRVRVKNVDVEKVGRSVEGNPVISSRAYIGAQVAGRYEQCRIVFGFPDKDDPAAGRVSIGSGSVLEGVCRGKSLERPHAQDEIPDADWYVIIARTKVVSGAVAPKPPPETKPEVKKEPEKRPKVEPAKVG